MSEIECRNLLLKALDYDESGDKENAIDYYLQSVEVILTIENKEIREKLNGFAKQALDRAEVLKGIKNQQIDVNTNNEITSSSAEQSSDISEVTENFVSFSVSGSSAYTEEEKRVLEHTSHINSNIFVPFMDIDLREKFNYPIPFTDKDGRLELSPKQKRDLIKWCRISELCENPKLVIGTIVDFYSIKQTLVSDCSFVASLAVAALYEKRFGKRLITSIIYPRNSKNAPIYNSSGKYSVRLHVNGVPRKVIIDDYLPVGRHNQLLCSYSSNHSEFWVSLLEKAYMKLMGGYDFPGSNSNIDLHALTGWIPERVSIKTQNADFDSDSVFARLKDGLLSGRCLITVATGDLSDEVADRAGLVSTHAYAVLDLKEIDGAKLLQLKNPWSHLRWKGNYSELDTVHWTSELKEELNYNPELAEQIDNGVFWIDYNSILKFFDVFYLNWNPQLFQYTYCIHQSWSAGIGPTKDAYTIGDNPQFSLTVGPGHGSVWILLTRHITNIEDFRENHEYITVLVYQNNGKRVYYPYDPKPLVDGIRINSPHYLCKIKLDTDAVKKYTLVVSQYEKTATIYYSLRAYCRNKFELKKITNFQYIKELQGEWNSRTAGGCPNYPQTYRNNPTYRLTISPKDYNYLVIELRAPKIYQVGIELTVVSLEDETVTAPFISKTSGNYRSGFCVLDLYKLPAGIYTIIPSTFLPSQEGPYFLKIKCSSNICIEPIVF